MLHVKLTVNYTVRFTCNIQFSNSAYFIFNQFKSYKFALFFCCRVCLQTDYYLFHISFNFLQQVRGAVVEWLEQLGYGAESRRIA